MDRESIARLPAYLRKLSRRIMARVVCSSWASEEEAYRWQNEWLTRSRILRAHDHQSGFSISHFTGTICLPWVQSPLLTAQNFQAISKIATSFCLTTCFTQLALFGGL